MSVKFKQMPPTKSGLLTRTGLLTGGPAICVLQVESEGQSIRTIKFVHDFTFGNISAKPKMNGSSVEAQLKWCIISNLFKPRSEFE